MHQILVLCVILSSLVLFVTNKIRYDIVALIALLVLTLTGIVLPDQAFSGFSHPAVITVAAILVVSKGLLNVGAMDPLNTWVMKLKGGINMKLMLLMGVTAFFSSFMNNVGALALVMPVAIQVGKDSRISPSYLLMPIAFASLLGGMTTEIGTPPNLIISMYRQSAVMESYKLFDFTVVGVGLVLVGLIFIALVGYRLIPNRKGKEDPYSLFKVEDYLAELIVPEGSKVAGKSLVEFSAMLNLDLNVLSIVRNKINIIAPHAREIIEERDLLCVRMEPSELTKLVDRTGLLLKGAKLTSDESGKILTASDHTLLEIVLRDDSPLINLSAKTSQLRNTYNVNLVAISRHGVHLRSRLSDIVFKTGDILLLQVATQNVGTVLSSLRALPLAERGIRIQSKKLRAPKTIGMGIFAASILLTTFEVVPVHVSFTLAAVVMILTGIIPLKDIYESIEWPVIVMLGAMLPLGDALETTGAAQTVAQGVLSFSNDLSPEVILMLLMLMTLLLTNIINNAAAAVLMAPIGISLATGLGVSVDPFLMAVAIGSSSAFMTPIGHQSNTLIMGPGGYQFSDYWRLGLPLSILVMIVGLPLILWVWPL